MNELEKRRMGKNYAKFIKNIKEKHSKIVGPLQKWIEWAHPQVL